MSKIGLVGTLLRTVKHLKPIQIFYQLKYKIRKPKALTEYTSRDNTCYPFTFTELPEVKKVLVMGENDYSFSFLNLERTFKDKIDWKFEGHGRLWNYNLQYVDFVRQDEIAVEDRVSILEDLYKQVELGSVKLEPYPVSLRIMNTIRFISKYTESENRLSKYVKAEATYLNDNMEFHILANHLLENIFAMLMSAHFFKVDAWIKKAESLLQEQLKEQILEDGAHYELSPMYHQIILFRVLEAIDYLPDDSKVRRMLLTYAGKMTGWISAISFSNGNFPHFNDSNNGIAYTTNQLLMLADQLGVNKVIVDQMSDSGYRKYTAGKLEIIADVEGISPSYQPGHAHADTFSFCLNHDDREIIVDTGISTYNICPERSLERGTSSHNTLTIDGLNSSEVWSGFRVGRRATTKVLSEDKNQITAEHNGFKSSGVIHERSFSKKEDATIEIIDIVKGNLSSVKAELNFHFSANLQLELKGNNLVINDDLLISFQGESNLEWNNYNLCTGYNKFQQCSSLKVRLHGNKMITKIKQL